MVNRGEGYLGVFEEGEKCNKSIVYRRFLKEKRTVCDIYKIKALIFYSYYYYYYY